MQRRCATTLRKPKWDPEVGQPHKGTWYNPDIHDSLCHNLRLLFGANANSIAKALGLSEGTMRVWLDLHPSFREAWDAGGVEADAAVARSYFRSATVGHALRQEKVFYNSKTDKLVTATYVERVPPSVQAQVNWLANRQPKLWKSLRSSTEITDADGNAISMPPVIVLEVVDTPEQARAIEARDERDRKTIPGKGIWSDTTD